MNQSSSVKQPKIFVGGGSWARGEWEENNPRVSHRGIIQYFLDDGHTVIDASLARSWHFKSIQKLERHLTREYQENDIVFFMLADPLLDVVMPELHSTQVKRNISVKNLEHFTEEIKRAGGVIALLRETQNKIYKQLNDVATKFNVTIHCIGGNSNVNTNLLSQYPNLTPTVMSWMNLLVGHLREHKHIRNPEFVVSYTWGIDYINLSTYTEEFAEQVKREVNSLSDKTNVMNELIFHPDGLHPNREGHKILYNYLVNKLNL